MAEIDESASQIPNHDENIRALEERLRQLTSEQVKFFTSSVSEILTRSSSAEVEKRKTKLDHVESQIKEVRKTIDFLRSLNAPSFNSPAFSNTNSPFVPRDNGAQFSPSHVVPRNLPRFGVVGGQKIIADPEHFLEVFETTLIQYGLSSDDNWRRLLPSCLERIELDWAKVNLLSNEDILTWSSVKNEFLKRFLSPQHKEQLLQALWTASMKPGESILSFCDRFQKLMRDCCISDDSLSLSLVFLSRLPYSAQDFIDITRNAAKVLKPELEDFISISEISSYLRRYAVRHTQRTFSLSKNQVLPQPKATDFSRKPPSYSSNLYCDFHGSNSSHSTSNCRHLNSQKRSLPSENKSAFQKSSNFPSNSKMSNVPNSQTIPKSNFNSVTCYSCGESGHVSSKCPTKMKSKATNIMEETPPEDSLENCLDLTLDDYDSFLKSREIILQSKASKTTGNFHVVKSSSKEVSRPEVLRIPVIINETQVHAFLDTGANKSLISHDWVKAHDIPISPTSGQIELAEINSTIPRIGEVGPLLFRCGKSSVKHTFEVMNQNEELTIGLDLFHELGFGIIGLPTHFPNTIREVPDIEDETPSLFIDKPQDDLSEFKSHLLGSIQKSLDDNSNLPTDTFCNIPESVVTIETPPGVSVYRRQYPIPITIHHF